MFTCFSGLSRAERAHVRRCQAIAQAEGLSVVSSGVLAAPAAGAPAGAHFWLVGSPTSGAVSFVWLSAGGRRLLCGCPRRRGPSGALTCAHAQTVRLWLLAAAGLSVPVLAPVPPAPVPPLGGAALPVPAVAPAALPPVFPVASVSRRVAASRWRRARVSLSVRLRLRRRLCMRRVVELSTVGATAPAPVVPAVAQAAHMGACPACEAPAPRDALAVFGVCAECLDLMALAESAPPVARCRRCGSIAVGETSDGPLCSAHLHATPATVALAAWRHTPHTSHAPVYTRAELALFELEAQAERAADLAAELSSPDCLLSHAGL
jgi:hypothetical protein